MLCQKCQQRPATVFFSQTVGNKTTQAHLCEPCAREQMKAQGLGNPMALNPFAAMANFFNQFMGGADIQEAAPGRAPAPEPLGQCPHCGYQFSNFRQNGRLGCPRCYEAFAPLLEPLVAGLHGNARHADEAPSSAPPDARPTEAELREKMKAAIEKEKFEEAARLRDEIQRLQERPNV
ncbi:MAG TPA: UvrB/UvrC motif-containing protein [bacterium]|nr:UvrB/UvrC motif-containing protein [bacterium]